MCFSFSKVHQSSKWNWDGERIVHDSIVPSSRPPVGHNDGNYDVDVREFLVSERNVVMRRTLEIDIRKFISKLPDASWEFFRSRDPGSFDFRAHIIAEYVSNKIEYLRSNGLDPWQFPEETLSLKSGDCEDRALLIASLLLASGISSFNVRVALGKFRTWTEGERQDFDHVWVMYKGEAGYWQTIEPAHAAKIDKQAETERAMPEKAEYVPYYLFNDVHLWQVQQPSAYGKNIADDLKQDWSSLHPEFAGWVHKSLLSKALTPDICPPWVLNALNRHFTSFFWQKKWTVDDVDFPGSYDPREHFDNGYITEGWQEVTDRLQQFEKGSLENIDAFHLAAHAIADFYAHTSYGHFGSITNGNLELFDPDNPDFTLPKSPDYSPGTSFDFQKFTRNGNVNNGTVADAVNSWQGKIISGRYAQEGDSHGWAERITSIPSELLKDKDFSNRGLLPHHNEIAVDEDNRSDKHILYPDRLPHNEKIVVDEDNRNFYFEQYRLRYDAAARHIGEVFKKHWKPRVQVRSATLD